MTTMSSHLTVKFLISSNAQSTFIFPQLFQKKPFTLGYLGFEGTVQLKKFQAQPAIACDY